MARKYHQGFFYPSNPGKYRGNVKRIIYRSSYERAFMNYLDRHPDILQWASEKEVISYFDPTTNVRRRYYPDFWIRKRNPDGTESVGLVEIKPAKEAVAPVPRKRKTKSVIQEHLTYAKNTAKWKAAQKYCQNKGWSFQIMTEYELNKLGILWLEEKRPKI